VKQQLVNQTSRVGLFKKAMAGVAATVIAVEAGSERAGAATAPGFCNDHVQTILNTALMGERLAATLYYGALTSPALMRHRRLGGSSVNPNDPGVPPNGQPSNVHYLQAALDAEMKHARMLTDAGAQSPFARFYFPATAFQTLGSPTQPASFLGVQSTIELTLGGIYADAVSQFTTLIRPDLALLAARMMGVEAEHRVLGRVIAGVTPPNNLTLESAPLACVSDAAMLMAAFLTGARWRFPVTATRTLPLPTAAQAAAVIGRYSTRLVTSFL